ncbi:molybdopterin-guanine dinucleotide biosynthesis protein B [Bacillus timonensis]|nr:molybdopterin-guanine dinucleotide biosynthesis protein B [Bacillus timonensis]
MAVGIKKRPPILQVVGYQNSGKTTLMVSLIEVLSREGLKVGTIKHHGHGGKPQLPDRKKDSEKHQQAGAMVSAVEGDGLLHLQASLEQLDVEKMIDFYQFFEPDVILVEGYKKAPFPKALLIRSMEDVHLLEELDNIIAVITWGNVKITCEIPVFDISEKHEYVKMLVKSVRDKG